MSSYCVYILQCQDDSYYTGVTRNVEKRVYEHQQGLLKGSYTHSRRPVKLVFSERFSRALDAIEREKQIKGWTRKKKEALISGDYSGLQKFSKNRQ